MPPKKHRQITPVQPIFWTGGFDSTYCLCKHLFDPQNTTVVQPIYLAFADVDKANHGRKSRAIELETMQRIQKALARHHPKQAAQLKPLLVIEKNVIMQDTNLMRAFQKLQAFRCVPTQYERLGRYAAAFVREHETLNGGVEVGILGLDSRIGKLLRGHITQQRIQSHALQTHPTLQLFEALRFPIFGLTKQALLQDARKVGFDTILAMTWSCWFPKNGQACQRCEMCRERVLPHPSNNKQHRPQPQTKRPTNDNSRVGVVVPPSLSALFIKSSAYGGVARYLRTPERVLTNLRLPRTLVPSAQRDHQRHRQQHHRLGLAKR